MWLKRYAIISILILTLLLGLQEFMTQWKVMVSGCDKPYRGAEISCEITVVLGTNPIERQKGP